MVRTGQSTRGIGQPKGAAVAVGIGDAINIGNEWSKSGLVWMSLAGERQCEQGAAVKSVVETDDRRALGVSARDLDGVLHRLGAGRHQQRLFREIAGNQLVEPLRQSDVGLVGRHAEAGVNELLKLRPDALHYHGRAVPDVFTSDAPGKIDEAIAVHIFDYGAFSLGREHRCGVKYATRDGGLTPAHQFLRLRTRNWCSQLDG